MVGTVFVACRSWTRPTARVEVATPHELETLAAIADAFIPSEPGSPGAHEVDAVSVITDPAHGVNPYVSEVVSDLDDWCQSMRGGKRFVELADDDREVVLEERMGLRGAAIKSLYLPAYEGILALTKLAFFGAMTNVLGTNWLGFPGASAGYDSRSAAGAYASTAPLGLAGGASTTIAVTGEGAVSHVALSAFVTSPDAAKLTLRLTSPDGKSADVAVDVASGEALVDDVRAALTGGAAAGTWKLAVASVAGSGQLAMWSLRLRTNLDDGATS